MTIPRLPVWGAALLVGLGCSVNVEELAGGADAAGTIDASAAADAAGAADASLPADASREVDAASASDASPVDAATVDAAAQGVDAGPTADASQPADATLLADGGALYFQGDMQNVVITGDYFDGWDEVKGNPLVESLGLFVLGAPANYIAIHPTFDGGRKAMQSVMSGHEAGVGKTNLNLEFKDTADLAVYHTSHRMHLNEGFQHLADAFPGAVGAKGTVAGWMTIWELWTREDPGMSGTEGGSARWTLSLDKAAGVNQPWTWELVAEYMQPVEKQYQSIWSATNSTSPLPIGQWFTLDLYLKRGEGAAGRMILTVTPDGGAPVMILDVNDTTIYPGRPDLRLQHWTMFKVYTNDAIMDWVATEGRQLIASYDDFKWYRD